MNFSISPVKLPWDCYTVKSVTYFHVALKRDMNFVLRKGHFNFLFKFTNCESYLLFIKENGVIALETVGFFTHNVVIQVDATKYFLSFPDSVELHFLMVNSF